MVQSSTWIPLDPAHGVEMTRLAARGLGRRPRRPMRRLRRSADGAIFRRRHSERRAKAGVEGREIAKAAVERNGQHRIFRGRKTPRGAPHSDPQDMLVWGHPDRSAEDAQEMMLAEARYRRQTREIQRLVGMFLDR